MTRCDALIANRKTIIDGTGGTQIYPKQSTREVERIRIGQHSSRVDERRRIRLGVADTAYSQSDHGIDIIDGTDLFDDRKTADFFLIVVQADIAPVKQQCRIRRRGP